MEMKIQAHRRVGWYALIAFVILCGPFVFAQDVGTDTSADTSSPPAPTPASKAISSPKTLGLAFSQKGVVAHVYVKAGDTVKTGQALADLDTGVLLGKLHERQAAAEVEQARLDQLTKGIDPNASAANDPESAKIELENSKLDLLNSMQDAYARADDVVRARIDQVLVNSANPAFNQSINFRYTTDFILGRTNVESVLLAFKADIDAASSADDPSVYLASTKRRLSQIRSFMDSASLVINGINPDPSTSATTVRNWKLDLAIGRTNFSTGVKNLLASEKRVREAALKLKNANQKSNLEYQTLVEEAKVKQIQGDIETYQASIKSMTLLAPSTGTVKKVSAKVGLYVPGGTAVIVLASGR